MLSTITDHKNGNVCHFPGSRKEKDSITEMDELEFSAIQFVKKIGVRPNLFGYRLLISSIIEASRQASLFSSLSGSIYPVVAEHFGCTVETVERNIRRAIDSAYEYDPERLKSVFYYKTGKPYVSEVISIAVEMIRFNNMIC